MLSQLDIQRTFRFYDYTIYDTKIVFSYCTYFVLSDFQAKLTYFSFPQWDHISITVSFDNWENAIVWENDYKHYDNTN